MAYSHHLLLHVNIIITLISRIGRVIKAQFQDTEPLPSSFLQIDHWPLLHFRLPSFPRFLPSTPLNLVEKEVEKSQNRISLRVRNNELLGAKDDFRITRSYLTRQGVLHLEVPSEILEGRTTTIVTTPCGFTVAGHRVCGSFLLHIFL